MAKKKLCFVIMPFANNFDDIYFGIQKALETRNYESIRADSIHDTGSVIRHTVQDKNLT